MIARTQSIAQIVLDHSECAQVCQRHHIDFCCRGAMSLETAAHERGVDLDSLVQELERVVADRRGERASDPRELTTPRLVAHIVSTHHEYLRNTLPFVRTLAEKVGRVHGDHNPKLRDLDRAVRRLADTLLPHLDDEENSLFPAVTAQAPNTADVRRQLESMTAEHLEVADLLEQVRTATEDFTIPDWACGSYRTLFAEMKQLEGDVFAHVHLENHVLKPRFVTAE